MTPPPRKLHKNGKFSLNVKKGDIHMAADGRVNRNSAHGHYSVDYSTLGSLRPRHREAHN